MNKKSRIKSYKDLFFAVKLLMTIELWDNVIPTYNEISFSQQGKITPKLVLDEILLLCFFINLLKIFLKIFSAKVSPISKA